MQKSNSINISSIVQLNIERQFFRWLRDHNIEWYQGGSNLNYINLVNKEQDIDKIKNYWSYISD